jgi:hypothetical protein
VIWRPKGVRHAKRRYKKEVKRSKKKKTITT